ASQHAFQNLSFHVLTNYTFNSGINYLLTLTSTADTGSKTWYIKEPYNLESSGSATITLAGSPLEFNSDTTPVSALTVQSIIAAPAPSALLILFSSWCSALWLRRGRISSATR
ncbi:MAG: hypothetical protein ACKOZX_02170, partial [Gammaproteobacteria bacterium]